MNEGYLAAAANGGVLQLTISNPAQRNALTPSMLASLIAELDEAGRDPSLRVVVLRGEGTIFSSGYSLSSFPTEVDLHDEDELTAAADALETCTKPTVAVLNGDAIGAALHLALAADFRVADEKARVGMTPARFGIVYPWQGVRLSLDVLGPAVTRRLFLTGELLGSAEALDLRLIDDVADHQRPIDRVEQEWVAQLMRAAPQSVAGMKLILRMLSGGSALNDGQRSEVLALRRRALSSEDAKEALDAFRTKRTPAFSGR